MELLCDGVEENEMVQKRTRVLEQVKHLFTHPPQVKSYRHRNGMLSHRQTETEWQPHKYTPTDRCMLAMTQRHTHLQTIRDTVTQTHRMHVYRLSK